MYWLEMVGTLYSAYRYIVVQFATVGPMILLEK